MKTKKVLKIGTALLFSTIILSGCGEAYQPLPDEQRYYRIDRVLADIDYQNIGEIIAEERDDNGGTFAPSYKSIAYKGSEVYEDIAKRLSNPNDKDISHDCTCYEDSTLLNCDYYGSTINLGRAANKTSILITDSQNGRGKR